MSGFVGIVYFDGKPVDPNLLRRLTGYLAYRGPDAQEIWVEGSVGFGHTLFRSTYYCKDDHQPVVHQEGPLVLVTDARIDDRDNLRQQLEAKGYPVPVDAPASALIMAAYQAWGTAVSEHLLGDFAFALWDGHRRQLLASRDHFGMRMVHYAQLPHGIIVSNEIRPILCHPEVSNQLDDRAMASFLLFGEHDRTDECLTPFAEIKALAPAAQLMATAAGPAIKSYWTFPLSGPVLHYRNDEDYAAHCRDILQTAVKDRVQAPKVVAALSGGLDSTTASALCVNLMAAGQGPQEFRAFTAARSKEEEEFTFAHSVATSLGVEHHLFDVSGFKLLNPWIPTIVPFSNQTPAQGRAGTRLSASLGQVLLTGRSADNVLWPWSLTVMAQLRTAGLPATWRAVKTLRREFNHKPPLGTGLQAWLKGDRGPAPAEPFTGYPYPTWLNPDFEKAAQLPEMWTSFWTTITQPPTSQRHVMYQSLIDQNWHAHSAGIDQDFAPAELVDPYLDLRAIAFFASLPPLPWFYRKYILRLAMRDRLPPGVLKRPKTPAGDLHSHHFQQPDVDWIDQWQPCPELDRYVKREAVPVLTKANNPGRIYVDIRPLMLNLWLSSIRA